MTAAAHAAAVQHTGDTANTHTPLVAHAGRDGGRAPLPRDRRQARNLVCGGGVGAGWPHAPLALQQDNLVA